MNFKTVATVGVVLAMCHCTTAYGDLLWGDPNAMDGWQGSQTFTASDSTHEISVVVDYAVYAPGDYGGLDPSNGTEYVYAYQVRNTIDSDSAELSTFTVGLEANATVSWITWDVSASAPGQSGGIIPDISNLGATSARWFFLTNSIDFGELSSVLLFTSPNGPTMGNGSVINGGLSNIQAMPTPTPEPGTVMLLAMGASALLYRPAARRLRQFRSARMN